MLAQNYPNPFNLETTISFQLVATEHINLIIYDMLGKKVRTLVNCELNSGNHHVNWDGRNEYGEIVSSGIYLYQLENNKMFTTHKMLLIK
jgi:flagellar hook assembly protein FlgD